MAEQVLVNPKSERLANAPLDLAAGDGIEIITIDFPTPESELTYAAAVDTEGEAVAARHRKNVKIPFKLLVKEPGPEEIASANYVIRPMVTDLTDLSANAGSPTITRELSNFGRGDFCAKVVTDATAFSGIKLGVGGGVAIPDDLPVNGSVWVRAETGTVHVQLQLEERLGDNSATVGTTTSSDIVVGTAWTRIVVPRTFGSDGSNTRRFTLVVRNTSGFPSQTFRVTGWQVELFGPTSLMTGDTPGCRWLGTPHASATVRPAPDGTRFAQIIADLERTAYLVQEEGQKGGLGAWLRRDPEWGDPGTYRIVDMKVDIPTDWRFILRKNIEVPGHFEARPFVMGDEVTGADNVDNTNDYLKFTIPAVEGDLPAVARIVIDNDSATYDAWEYMIGLRSRFYDSAATAGVHFQAEALTPLNGGTLLADTAASGGTCVHLGPSALNWQEALSTQAVGGGAHMTHKGKYVVLVRARVLSSSPDAWLSFAHTVGDGARLRRGPAVEVLDCGNSKYHVLNLGAIDIGEGVAAGTHKWEGRLLHRTTESPGFAGCRVDWIKIIPAEQFVHLAARPRVRAASGVQALDPITQHSSGTLTGKVAPVGGTWVYISGDTDDWNIPSTGTWKDHAQRTSVSDTATRMERLGTGTLGDQLIRADFLWDTLIGDSTFELQFGVFGRYSTNKWVAALLELNGPSVPPRVIIEVNDGFGAVNEVLREVPFSLAGTNQMRTIALYIDDDGRILVWVANAGDELGEPIAGHWEDLCRSGQSMATGGYGVAEQNRTAQSCLRVFRNFQAYSPARDAAAFSSQSAEWAWDGSTREDAAGSLWTPVSSDRGDAFYLPPSGREKRTTEVVVYPTAGQISDSTREGWVPDPLNAHTSKSARVFWRPRAAVIGAD